MTDGRRLRMKGGRESRLRHGVLRPFQLVQPAKDARNPSLALSKITGAVVGTGQVQFIETAQKLWGPFPGLHLVQARYKTLPDFPRLLVEIPVQAADYRLVRVPLLAFQFKDVS
jgi:hypothetical protein